LPAPASEDQLRRQQARLVESLKQARRVTDAEYEPNKMALSAEFNADSKGGEYADNPNGFGTPEQNGIWPRPDWNDKQVKERWEARLENLLLPEMVSFFQTRAALMKQLKPREVVDLDRLPGQYLSNAQSPGRTRRIEANMRERNYRWPRPIRERGALNRGNLPRGACR
jgi:hypothetical protein